MNLFKWLAYVVTMLSSPAESPQLVETNINQANQPVIQASCKPFPECEIESLEAQGN